MKYVELGNTGVKVSFLSLGTAGFCNLYGVYNGDQSKKTVEKALECGINYIDTAPWYGQGVSETCLGEALKGIPREKYYLATKVGRYETDPKKMFDFSAAKTRASIQESLKRLQLSYVDVIQIHDIEFAPSIDYIVAETLPVLREAVDAGLAKYIGITGYAISALVECVQKSPIKIDTVLCYARLSMFDTSLQQCADKFPGIAIVCAAPLCMGILTNAGPQPWHPADEELKAACRKAGEYCKSHNIELAKLAIHTVFQYDFPLTHLIGMMSVEDVTNNIDVMTNGLNPKETEVLEHIQTNIFAKLTKRNWEGVELAQRNNEQQKWKL